MAFEENPPYKIYQNIDSVPISGSLSGSTPPWATPSFYIVNNDSVTFSTIAEASHSCIVSMSMVSASSFQFDGTTYTYKAKKGCTKEMPIVGVGDWKYRYAGAGLNHDEKLYSGSEARTEGGYLKQPSSHYMVLDADGNKVWSTVLHIDYDTYVSESSIPPLEEKLDNMHNRGEWKKAAPSRIHKAPADPPAPPPPAG